MVLFRPGLAPNFRVDGVVLVIPPPFATKRHRRLRCGSLSERSIGKPRWTFSKHTIAQKSNLRTQHLAARSEVMMQPE